MQRCLGFIILSVEIRSSKPVFWQTTMVRYLCLFFFNLMSLLGNRSRLLRLNYISIPLSIPIIQSLLGNIPSIQVGMLTKNVIKEIIKKNFKKLISLFGFVSLSPLRNAHLELMKPHMTHIPSSPQENKTPEHSTEGGSGKFGGQWGWKDVKLVTWKTAFAEVKRTTCGWG